MLLKLTIFDYLFNEIQAGTERTRQVTIDKSFTEVSTQAQTSAYYKNNIVNQIYLFQVIRGLSSVHHPGGWPPLAKLQDGPQRCHLSTRLVRHLVEAITIQNVSRDSHFFLLIIMWFVFPHLWQNFLLDQEKWNKSFAQTIQTTQQLSVAVATASERKYEIKKKQADRNKQIHKHTETQTQIIST